MNNLTETAIRILEARYLLRDGAGKIIETPAQMFRRVSMYVSKDEAKWFKKAKSLRKQKNNPFESLYRHLDEKSFSRAVEKRFYKLMTELSFLPNSPTLMNAGKPKAQLSACFVLPIADSLKDVLETLKNACLIHKSGGGTGFNFGKLRSKGSLILSSSGQAAGPIGFLKIFDEATNVIKQGGVRRGANMAILPISHPDIESFIQCKKFGGIENFNISVAVSNAFMSAVEKNEIWNLIDPRTKKIVKTLKAVKLWRLIAELAWETGDPGVVFIDRINDDNPTPEVGMLESTNPCGEQPLLPFESCNLGSINLLNYADINKKNLNWKSLEQDIPFMIRFLDNIIDTNNYPLVEIEEITLRNRKIGLGIMGWADLLLAFGIPYDSDEALNFAGVTQDRIQKIAWQASQALALERGAFANYNSSKLKDKIQIPARNATVTTIAPTGTISLIAGVSSGIEPVFAYAFKRVALDGEVFYMTHPILEKELKNQELKGFGRHVLRTGSVSKLKGISKKMKRVFKNAHEIKPLAHVKMQAVFQRYTDNGVSKTINLPKNASISQIQQIYKNAYELGCKGITVYRDKSKRSQVLNRGVK